MDQVAHEETLAIVERQLDETIFLLNENSRRWQEECSQRKEEIEVWRKRLELDAKRYADELAERARKEAQEEKERMQRATRDEILLEVLQRISAQLSRQ